MNLAYGLYMGEAEGYLDTRESKIQKIIREVKNYPNSSIPEDIFYQICEECGIAASTLSQAEIKRITRAIER
jgi:hypothetical protein